MNSANKYHWLSHPRGWFGLFLWIAASLVLLRCADEWTAQYEPHIKEDYQIVQQGSGGSLADTLILYVKDDPTVHDLPLMRAAEAGEAFPDAGILAVHQTISKDTLLAMVPDLSRAEAREFNDASADILNETIEFFKLERKFVVVYGLAFGCFIAQIAIQRGGILADAYVCEEGRLKIDESFAENFFKKRDAHFSDDGLNQINSKYIVSEDTWGLMSLIGDVLVRDYVLELADHNLEKVLYLHEPPGGFLGRLSDEEINFLTAKGATILDTTQDGSAWDNGLGKAIREFIR